MYLPQHFEETRIEELHRIITEYPLGALVLHGPNGLGNLIVGYNEPRPEGNENIHTGSHNVVVGLGHNFSRVGGLVVGITNTISGDFATVSGGRGNSASAFASAISGGGGFEQVDGNTAVGDFAAGRTGRPRASLRQVTPVSVLGLGLLWVTAIFLCLGVIFA
jgi:hypothetical protein